MPILNGLTAWPLVWLKKITLDTAFPGVLLGNTAVSAVPVSCTFSGKKGWFLAAFSRSAPPNTWSTPLLLRSSAIYQPSVTSNGMNGCGENRIKKVNTHIHTYSHKEVQAYRPVFSFLFNQQKIAFADCVKRVVRVKILILKFCVCMHVFVFKHICVVRQHATCAFQAKLSLGLK